MQKDKGVKVTQKVEKLPNENFALKRYFFNNHFSSRAIKNTVESISEVHLLLQLLFKILSKKLIYKQKKTRPIVRKTAKNCYLNAAFCQKKTLLKVEKPFTDQSA